MRFAKARLAVALVVLFAWVGFIGYQALMFGQFPVVSHSQLLNATAVVIADVQMDASGRPTSSVRIVEVLWPAKSKRLVGETIEVPNLPQARSPNEGSLHLGRLRAGRYILPFEEKNGRQYVAELPPSPGFEDSALFIYPDIPIVREQLAAIWKAAGK